MTRVYLSIFRLYDKKAYHNRIMNLCFKTAYADEKEKVRLQKVKVESLA